uniref:Uncharacterized protein n=1 Tax=Arundo donax TaxID=35708 RepID=A0A0A9DGJ7_ARUDO
MMHGRKSMLASLMREKRSTCHPVLLILVMIFGTHHHLRMSVMMLNQGYLDSMMRMMGLFWSLVASALIE